MATLVEVQPGRSISAYRGTMYGSTVVAPQIVQITATEIELEKHGDDNNNHNSTRNNCEHTSDVVIVRFVFFITRHLIFRTMNALVAATGYSKSVHSATAVRN